jgi:hypothetical protein
MANTNGRLAKLSSGEVGRLTRPARAKRREEKRDAHERATRGLRLDIRATTSLYRSR